MQDKELKHDICVSSKRKVKASHSTAMMMDLKVLNPKQ